MVAVRAHSPIEIGTPMEGGYFAGLIRQEAEIYGLIVAPKDAGEHKSTIWIPRMKKVPGATSPNDGLANTRAMAEAGSKLAQWALDLSIGGHTDWCLPAQDELEICYRAFKPTADQNSQWSRSGMNVSAVPSTYPYSLDLPAKTVRAAFEAGGTEAFETEAYWTSTQHAADGDYAWRQLFSDGTQDDWYKDDELRARAVRRISIS